MRVVVVVAGEVEGRRLSFFAQGRQRATRWPKKVFLALQRREERLRVRQADCLAASHGKASRARVGLTAACIPSHCQLHSVSLHSPC